MAEAGTPGVRSVSRRIVVGLVVAGVVVPVAAQAAEASGTPLTTTARHGSTPAAESGGAGRAIPLVGTVGTVREEKGAAHLASYVLESDGGNDHVAYLRSGDRFVRTPYREAVVSPDGRWVAGVPGHLRYRPADEIVLIDRTGNRKYTVRTPRGVAAPQWSPDGKRVLLTAYKSTKTVGFITIDVAHRVPALSETGKPRPAQQIGADGRFFWNGDGSGVMRSEEDGSIALYGLTGRRTRLYKRAGTVEEWNSPPSLFSPSGRTFATYLDDGTGKDREIGVVDASTGRVVHRVRGGFTGFFGWYGDDRLIVRYEGKGEPRPVAFRYLDLAGKARGTLVKEKLVLGPGNADFTAQITRLQFMR
ncbi:hypothetical protein [Sphaerisporangium fuscum]|uniref:hypothetical protein n=1 Tax=Sphaerisporangium fuscum TaxID=2835868 RepID=UPI001BDCC5B7|nr:hypothetical protein [Sphaerisporangium fuscum]